MSLNELRCILPYANNALRFKNYSSYFECRKQKGTKNVGGGVAIYFHENPEQIEDTFPNEFSQVDAVIVKVKISGQWSAFISLYNPLDKKLELLFLNFIKIKYKNILIIADLNAKTKELSGEFNSKEKRLVNLINDSYLFILNNKRNLNNKRS